MEEKLDSLWKLMTEVHAELKEKYDVAQKYQSFVNEVKRMQPTTKEQNKKGPSSTAQESNTDSSRSGLIQLNVGGQVFTTQRSVLTCSRAEDSMLFAVGAGWFENDENREETFIDRDGTLFGVILDWLRQPPPSPKLQAPTSELSNEVSSESDPVQAHRFPSVLHSWSCIHHFAASATCSTVNTNKMLQHELSCLEVEARYYGLDELVKEIAELKPDSSVAPVCHWLYPDGWFEQLTPQRVRQLEQRDEENCILYCRASTPFIMGTKSTITIRVFDTDDFWIALTPSDFWHRRTWQRPPLGDLPREGDCDVVQITVDLTNIDDHFKSPSVKARLRVNGKKQSFNKDDPRVSGYSGLSLICSSLTEDAEFLIDEAQAIEVSTLPCT